MAYFELPTGYRCLTPASATSEQTIYAYNSRERDTYDLIGFDWVKTRHLTYNYDQDLSSYQCLTQSKLVPTTVLQSMILPATLIVICFFTIILNMFMGVRR